MQSLAHYFYSSKAQVLRNNVFKYLITWPRASPFCQRKGNHVTFVSDKIRGNEIDWYWFLSLNTPCFFLASIEKSECSAVLSKRRSFERRKLLLISPSLKICASCKCGNANFLVTRKANFLSSNEIRSVNFEPR